MIAGSRSASSESPKTSVEARINSGTSGGWST